MNDIMKKMLVIIIISILFYTTSSSIAPIISRSHSDELVQCVTDIMRKYFNGQKVISSYIDDSIEDDELFRKFHELNVVTHLSISSTTMYVPRDGYFVVARNYTTMTNQLLNLSKKLNWNPDAYFLIIVKSLSTSDLEFIFNRLLIYHVHNVTVVNVTDTYLYSYNAFDNYGCGKHYEDIISFGNCSQANNTNLYPNKHVTGLRNCTFIITVPEWPPFTVIPGNDTNKEAPLAYGVEPFLFRIVSEMCGFNVKIDVDVETVDSFATISSNLEAVGSLKALQNNDIDLVMGGMMLIPSRASAFKYVYDIYPYEDEIRFAVRKAQLVDSWKNLYLEFNTTVWILVLLSIIFYSILLTFLLRATDKSYIVFKLIDNLVLHGCKINCRSTVKCIFIIWVWFAYLVNTFYQSSLFSLTTNPVRERQISTESDINEEKLKPCFSNIMQMYYMESVESNDNTAIPGCDSTAGSFQKIMESNEYYTAIIYSLFKYNLRQYLDAYGYPLVYPLEQPYSKVIYAWYFYKGHPLLNVISSCALRLREMGFVAKAMGDMNYMNTLRHRFHAKEFKYNFVNPWSIYILGHSIATITFIFEKIYFSNIFKAKKYQN